MNDKKKKRFILEDDSEDDSWTISDLSNPDVPAPWKPRQTKEQGVAKNSLSLKKDNPDISLWNMKKVDNPDIKGCRVYPPTPKKIEVSKIYSPDSSLTDMESPPAVKAPRRRRNKEGTLVQQMEKLSVSSPQDSSTGK